MCDSRVLMFQMDSADTRYFSEEKFYMETTCYNQTAMVPMTQEYYTETTHYNNSTAMAQGFYSEATHYNNPTAVAQEFYSEATHYNNSTPMAHEFYSEATHYNNSTPMAHEFYSEATHYNNSTPMAHEFYSEATHYNNSTPMAHEFYSEATHYNNSTPMAQGFYSGATYYNNSTPMAQEFYSGATYYNNPTAMDPMAQGYYMDTPYYNNNSSDMAQGHYMETPYYYYNNPTATCMASMTQEHACMDIPWYNNYNHTATVPMAQDYYTETPTYSNNSTTVVPLTQEWVSQLRINVDDGYGSVLIMEKFLTSLSECERETPAYMDDSVQECTPGVGQNEVRWSSQSSSKSGQVTRSEMTQIKVAPPGDIGQNFSDDDVKSPVCLSQYDKHEGDVKGPKELQEDDLINSLDIDDWIMLLGSEAGTLYYSEDEEMSEMSEEVTRDSVGGPDGDSMEEKRAFPPPSIMCQVDWSMSCQIALHRRVKSWIKVSQTEVQMI
ncbi:uncharacterized protein LOC118419022 [Branchiostoma floridae]|uniref:Uncharacterized protein LOC118419022 n=1 Tax=Branchiostoma floridae TaxID=7739 RepID=A0A9J7MU09_BRAFL|nr:uncharacterized protein LOC118419022 [Branchiostoma floridae]